MKNPKIFQDHYVCYLFDVLKDKAFFFPEIGVNT